jgi:hypothetical protein
MIETHGWLSIALSTDGEGEYSIINDIKPLLSIVSSICSEQNVIDIRPLNGRYYITITNHPNHKGVEFDRVMMLIEYVATNYTGSYGLVYIRDDEDANGNDNEFVVYKLIRGKIIKEKDHYLSPCNPVIED